YLVVHQGHQRRDHERGSRKEQGRQLIAQALAAARGSHEQQPAGGQQRLDRLPLPGPEALVPELAQPRGEVVCRRVVSRSRHPARTVAPGTAPGGPLGGGADGASVKKKVAPRPVSASAQTRPPCRLITRRTV